MSEYSEFEDEKNSEPEVDRIEKRNILQEILDDFLEPDDENLNNEVEIDENISNEVENINNEAENINQESEERVESQNISFSDTFYYALGDIELNDPFDSADINLGFFSKHSFFQKQKLKKNKKNQQIFKLEMKAANCLHVSCKTTQLSFLSI